MVGAVRLVNRTADELTRTFKELMLQRLIDATRRRTDASQVKASGRWGLLRAYSAHT